MLTIYGIPNCDSCRKARRRLDARDVHYRFHDLRVDGIDRDTLERWAKVVGWKTLLNTRSATWRGLPAGTKKDVDSRNAVELMLEHPTLVKRPVAVGGGKVIVGWSEAEYDALR